MDWSDVTWHLAASYMVISEEKAAVVLGWKLERRPIGQPSQPERGAAAGRRDEGAGWNPRQRSNAPDAARSQPGDRAQLVGALGAIHTQRVERIEALETSWLRITSHAGSSTDMADGDALAHNLTLPIGSLAARGESFVLCHMLPLAHSTMSQLDQALRFIAHEAARLRAHGLDSPAPRATVDYTYAMAD